ncbi:outer membrane protein assembly factor [Riemerella anatipestifer]|uniref:translocation and assembly module lipoprotein TamL n=1 Tax=Riemerella anatipestifer TaxID=34085 RepID=UPI000D6894AF|nr:BamA/TamA family outer membrane protein [Riemerella anatipestifer]MRM85675.1 outer membrane protein assembly factor [Riemerella anatipestifer]MRM94952.1 outer membrane protein assembly factor [Riemerella anatipestifer]WPC13970.1 BamA/TamA family outer membrane protein [Riemerella anatipestifer]
MTRKHIRKYFQKYYLFSALTILLAFLYACSSTKKVPHGEALLTKNTIIYEDKKLFASEISNYIQQRPNKKVLFVVPLGLWLYNAANPKYDTILTEYVTYPNQMRNQSLRDSLFIKYGHPEYVGKSLTKDRFLHTVGEAPKILEQGKTIASAKNMRQFMRYRGYWDAKVTYKQDIDTAKQKAQVTYKLTFNEPTRIKNYYYSIPDSNIRSIYESEFDKSKIKTGDILDQKNLEEEVKRITERMREVGYYSFNRTNEEIYFTADTLESNKNVPLTMDIHRNDKDSPYKKTTIGKVDVFVVNHISDTLSTKPYRFDRVPQDDSVRIHKLDKQYSTRSLWLPIILKNREVYNQKFLDLTKRNVNAMNNFSIIDYKEGLRKNSDSILDVRYILKPLSKYEFKTAFDAHYSQILNFGFSPSVELTSRNVFGGAENLSTSFSGIIGTTKNAKDPGKIFNAYELSAQVALNVPRLLLPFKHYKLIPKRYSPTSSIILGTSIQNNIGMDRINFNGSLNYTANVNDVVSHRLSLFNTQLSLTRNKDSYYDLFRGDNEVRQNMFNLYQTFNPSYDVKAYSYDDVSRTIVSDNAFLNSLSTENRDLYNTFVQSLLNRDRQTQNVLISSLNYQFLYNEIGKKYFRHPFYFSGKMELAGNLISLFGKTKDSKSVLTDNEKTIFNIPYSQFVKFDADVRKYLSINRSTLVFRQFIGVGIPYGNSINMPFVRSYFNGGSNDIRAWIAFGGLGPADSQLNEKIRSFIMGNVKLTSNIEYRFPINSMFEGALFTDAGNIWSLKDNRNRLEDTFKFNKFYKQLGIGSGFGIRINVAYITLRVDFAYKMYDPNQPEGERWRISHIQPLKPTLNFAFGYPF